MQTCCASSTSRTASRPSRSLPGSDAPRAPCSGACAAKVFQRDGAGPPRRGVRLGGTPSRAGRHIRRLPRACDHHTCASNASRGHRVSCDSYHGAKFLERLGAASSRSVGRPRVGWLYNTGAPGSTPEEYLGRGGGTGDSRRSKRRARKGVRVQIPPPVPRRQATLDIPFLDKGGPRPVPWVALWGCSSVGRAQGWQSWGQGFESPQLHQIGATGLRTIGNPVVISATRLHTGQRDTPTPDRENPKKCSLASSMRRSCRCRTASGPWIGTTSG
jgi:hypothetical protein